MTRSNDDRGRPDSGIRCRRCGNPLRPSDAEARDNLPRSESNELVHRDRARCGNPDTGDDGAIPQAMKELQKDGVYELHFDDKDGTPARE